MLGKLENGNLKIAGGKILKYDDVVVANPQENDFINAGYKPIIDKRLEENEGFYQVAEYFEEEDRIVAIYHYEEIVDEEEFFA